MRIKFAVPMLLCMVAFLLCMFAFLLCMVAFLLGGESGNALASVDYLEIWAGGIGQ